ncbi:23S rRNA (uracil(747)-C(5))-methyltransferase RlmC [Utexia brackfieldae]|uniref:23S rRNA (uracil(747)-C(5))-methyltransferase RlmC n=1 Tax=Utexia brackfieldae TaxID=3074108 RepID=UPI00370D0700
MQCDYFLEGQCLSCSWLTKTYTQQLAEKQIILSDKLRSFQFTDIDPPVASETSAFRNKAKMAVLNTVEKPILGIINHQQQPIDLCDCPLYPQPLQQALAQLKSYIKTVGLVPYNINKKRGELKFIIMSYADNKFMLRFVLRSSLMIEKITASLDTLYQLIPDLWVISVNIQPKHAAILEGDEEIILSQADVLPIQLNHVPLYIRPQSFFQTNTLVAEQLYKTAANWVKSLDTNNINKIYSIWDLFCGVGGFGLHCTDKFKKLTGIEINQSAIICAKQSAQVMGLPSPDFQALDSTQFTLAQQQAPDLVLVNPPRRGLGQALANFLQELQPSYILYSSCNLDSLLADILLLENYHISKAQLFDMFPYTPHTETMLLLTKNR